MAAVSDLESIAMAGVETQERFVADCMAMDRAWMAGGYDGWLADYRKRYEEELYGHDRVDGHAEGEVQSELGPDATGP